MAAMSTTPTEGASLKKILPRELLAEFIKQQKASGKTVGFTSGTFDLLHAGHAQYLEAARAQCDVLVVGVNSDASVKSYKSPGRPFVPEQERAQVVAALGCVDRVFIFDELNNNRNVEILKPSIYFKAGDYSKDKLTSAPLVESYGGKVVLLPLREGNSSSSIISRIQNAGFDAKAAMIDLPKGPPRPALFLDRDGTLIEHVEYLHEPEKVKLLPGVIKGLLAFQAAGYALVVVTNQPGIGLGYFSKEQFFAANRELLRQVSKEGVRLDKVYFCPHALSEQCECRKPGTAFVKRAIEELNVDVTRSYFVGDMSSDIECGHRAGCKTILVGTGRGGADGLFKVKADYEFAGLEEAVPLIRG